MLLLLSLLLFLIFNVYIKIIITTIISTKKSILLDIKYRDFDSFINNFCLN